MLFFIIRRAPFLSIFLALVALFEPFPPPSALAQTESGPQRRLAVGGVDREWFKIPWKPSAGYEKSFETDIKLSQMFPGKILRWSNLLALKLENGQFVRLTDMGIDDTVGGFNCCEIFRLRDYWSDIGHYVVYVDRFETSNTLIISDITANFIEVKGHPYRDSMVPGLFIAVSSDDMEGYSAELWELENSAWKQVYKCEELVYNTSFFGWEEPRRAIFLITERDGTTRKATLSEDKGVWNTVACENERRPSRQ